MFLIENMDIRIVQVLQRSLEEVCSLQEECNAGLISQSTHRGKRSCMNMLRTRIVLCKIKKKYKEQTGSTLIWMVIQWWRSFVETARLLAAVTRNCGQNLKGRKWNSENKKCWLCLSLSIAQSPILTLLLPLSFSSSQLSLRRVLTLN
jgi:hypothetical protein